MQFWLFPWISLQWCLQDTAKTTGKIVEYKSISLERWQGHVMQEGAALGSRGCIDVAQGDAANHTGWGRLSHGHLYSFRDPLSVALYQCFLFATSKLQGLGGFAAGLFYLVPSSKKQTNHIMTSLTGYIMDVHFRVGMDLRDLLVQLLYFCCWGNRIREWKVLPQVP